MTKSGSVLILNKYYYQLRLPNNAVLYFTGLDSDGDLDNVTNDIEEIRKNSAVMSGTGFFVDEKGSIMTNRHVAQPFIEESDIKAGYRNLMHSISLYYEYLKEQVSDKYDDRKKIIKDLKKKMEFIKVSSDPVEFTKNCLKGYKVEDGVITLLVNNTLGDISRLYNECNKLKIYKINDKYISKEDVLELAVKKLGDSTDITFQFSRSLAEKDKKKALSLYQELLDYQIEALSIIGLLASQFRIMFQVKVLEEKNMRNDEIAKTLNEKSYRITKTRELTRYYSKRELLDLMIKLEDIDLKIKTTSVDANTLVQLFILNI